MSVKRERTKNKIKLIFEYGLDEVKMSVPNYDYVGLRYKGNDHKTAYEVSEFLLKVFYALLDMEIRDIEDTLNIKITNQGITRDGEKIDTVYIQ